MSTNAVITLRKGRDRSLRRRHPWIYSGAIAAVEGDPAGGGVVRVVDHKKTFVAWAYFNPASKLRARVLDWNEDASIDEDWWRARVTDRPREAPGDPRSRGHRCVPRGLRGSGRASRAHRRPLRRLSRASVAHRRYRARQGHDPRRSARGGLPQGDLREKRSRAADARGSGAIDRRTRRRGAAGESGSLREGAPVPRRHRRRPEDGVLRRSARQPFACSGVRAGEKGPRSFCVHRGLQRVRASRRCRPRDARRVVVSRAPDRRGEPRRERDRGDRGGAHPGERVRGGPVFPRLGDGIRPRRSPIRRSSRSPADSSRGRSAPTRTSIYSP